MMILGIAQRQKNDLSWIFPHYTVRFLELFAMTRIELFSFICNV